MRRFFTFLQVGLIITCLISALSATNVSGPVYGVWTTSGNPYNVMDTIFVPQDSTLIIEPGVQIIFMGTYTFEVFPYATLRAIGTEQDSILFTANNQSLGWKGIRFFNSSSKSRFEYCRFEYGKQVGYEWWFWGGGGAIICDRTSPTISHCLFINNTVSNMGGAILCDNFSNPVIADNVFINNTAYHPDRDGYGGAICCIGWSAPLICGNTFTDNVGNRGGAIYTCGGTIIENEIIGNSAYWWGGGIHGGCPPCYPCEISIISNRIAGNSAFDGGGIHSYWTKLNIYNNIINGNSASNNAGGIANGIQTLAYNIIYDNTADSCVGGVSCGVWENALIIGNTIVGNSANECGGIGFWGWDAPLTVNCILWGNIPEQITPSNWSQVTYSNIQGGWEGEGNINLDPQFEDPLQNNYYLQWNSPCIDSGNPDQQYNDPDGTRADMGALYYNQLPNAVPIILYCFPEDLEEVGLGSEVDFRVFASDYDGDSLSYDWVLNGTSCGTGKVLSLNFNNLGFNSLYAYVSDGASDEYVYWEFDVLENCAPTIVSYYPISIDSVFQGTGQIFRIYAVDPDDDHVQYNWLVNGEEAGTDSTLFVVFDSIMVYDIQAIASDGELFDSVLWTFPVVPVEIFEEGKRPKTPEKYVFHQNYPNPFNPSTVLSFDLPKSEWVSLTVYDITGRFVEELVNERLGIGLYHVLFDGSHRSSGIYIARFKTESFVASQKMILVK